MTARHGSGAMDTTTRGRVRAASRENSREARRRPAPNVASGPVGPATAAEWNDIADGLRERISRAEKALTLHAHTIGQLQTEATQQSNVQPSVVKRVESLAADMDRRFIEGGERVMQRVDRLEGELKLLYEHVRSFGQATDNGSQPSPPPGVPTYRFSTPPRQMAESPTGQNSESFGNDNDYDDSNLRHNAMPQQQYNSSNNNYSHSPGATAGADTEDFGDRAPPRFGLHPNPFSMPATAQDRWDPRMSAANQNQRADNWTRQPPPNVDPRFQRPPPTFDPRAPGPAQGHWAPPHEFCPSQMPPTPDMRSAANHCHATAVGFNARDDGYKIREKGVKELPIFDGKIEDYRYWRNKLTDHVAKDNEHWRILLAGAQNQPHHIEPRWLVGLRFGNKTGWDLSLDLWNLISDRVNKSYYEKRIRMAYGNEGNGFELWRRFFTDFQGSDEVVQNDGRTQLQTFPTLTNSSHMMDRLDEWQELMSMYGQDIGHHTRLTMLYKILPVETRRDIIKMKNVEHLHTTEATIAWLRMNSAWDKSDSLLKTHTKRSVHAVSGDGTDIPVPGSPDMSVPAEVPTSGMHVAAIVESVVAALKATGKGNGKGNRPRTPNRSQSPSARARSTFPKNSCYHCGKEGHSRTANAKTGRKGCDEFAALLKKHGNKLPEGYKGAFERHLETELKKGKSGGRVNALRAVDLANALMPYDAEDDSSDDEAILRSVKAIWQTECPDSCCSPFRNEPAITGFDDDDEEFPPLCGTCDLDDIVVDRPITHVSNSFGALSCPEDMTDAADVKSELASWAHSVNKESVNKQRKKGWILKDNEDIERIGKMFAGRRPKDSGKTVAKLSEDKLIDDLASLIEKKNSTMESTLRKSKKVWAMVDSGSFVTIANCAKSFGKKHLVTPGPASQAGVKYSNASGGEIINRGQTVITHHLSDGSTLKIPFQDADVQCPIISVKDFLKVGSMVKFKNEGGIIKLPDGRVMQFQERHGVYFILLDLGVDHDNEDGEDVTDNPHLCTPCIGRMPDFHRPAP